MRARLRALLVSGLALAAPACGAGTPVAPGAADAGEPAVAAPCAPCARFADAEEVGKLDSSELRELSGLGASRRHKDVFYTHNDSGDRGRFFAIDARAALRATYELDGVVATDIEDVDVGPCPAGSCVFLGDIGDNEESRREIQIYRVAEPDLTSGRLTPEVFTLSYPDGPHNAETLMVAPGTGDLVLVTKSPSGTSGAYALEAGTPPGRATLRKIGELIVPVAGVSLVTGGSFHPCDKRLVLRTYAVMLEYRFAGGLETLFASPPTIVPAGREPQGEAVTYSVNGDALFTVSEGKQAALHRSACEP